jgi:3-oxoacyl-[acyl-carrier-protein] synthase II
MLDDRLPVVTGMGAVSPVAVGVEPFWRAVLAGENGSRPVRSFDTEGLRNHRGCEVADADLPEVDGRGEPVTRATRLAVVAAAEALAAAGLGADAVELLCVGTTMGELPDIETRLGDVDSHSDAIAHTIDGNFAGRVASVLGVEAPAITVATSCSAGNIAICRATDLIRDGRVDRAMAGGADAFSRLAFIGFSRMRGMAPEICQPFAQGRKGMLLAEGAGFLVLESLASARRRGAPVLAAVTGYGLSCDAYHVATPAPHGRGAAVAMSRALTNAGLAPDEVDYVSAHGTGTVQNDLSESGACREVFGEHRPYVSSLKALLGHSMGAASALEAVASVLSIRDGRLIPAWNVDEPDPKCDVRLPLPDEIDGAQRVSTVLSNAFAFGGNNSCLVLRQLPN